MEALGRLYNCVSLLGWLSVQTLTTSILLGDKDAMKLDSSEHFALPIQICQMVQALQVLDILLILLKISSGNILGSLAHILGRLLVAEIYMSTDIAPVPIANVLIAWSLADTNRYLYYIVKNPLTTWLRYNAFLILYPIGIYGEMTVINDYLKKT